MPPRGEKSQNGKKLKVEREKRKVKPGSRIGLLMLAVSFLLIPRRTFLPLNQHLTGFLIPKQHLSGLDRLRR
jgi:hypothetical protein